MRGQYDQLDDSTAAVATGLQSIGRLVVSAALLMCVPLAAIGMSGGLTMKLFGVGTVFAALVDVLVVRILLGSAVMKLMGRAAWWAPGPLARFCARYGIKETRCADRHRQAGSRSGLNPARRGRSAFPRGASAPVSAFGDAARTVSLSELAH
ncbi:MMPL family transporter [Streptomyces sp. NPDC057136]|uniref:MMPL family transporter n=1 Tax=Streptomyces sp. NPDC057136 TaxID=3346029 RepID=UPI003642A331